MAYVKDIVVALLLLPAIIILGIFSSIVAFIYCVIDLTVGIICQKENY